MKNRKMAAILDWLDIFLCFCFRHLSIHKDSALQSFTKISFVDVAKNMFLISWYFADFS